MVNRVEKQAQGTIEYLVIIGIVVVLSLVVVGIISSTGSGSAGTISSTSGKISQTSGAISISEAAIDVNGNGLVKLKNNSGGSLTVTKLSMDGVEVDSTDTSMSSTADGLFSLTNLGSACSCVGFIGQKKTCTLLVYATSEYGIDKKYSISVTVDCIPKITLDNVIPIVPPVVASPVVSLLSPVDNNLTKVVYNSFNFTLRSPDVNVTDCNLKINSNVDANHIHLGSLVSSDTNYSIKYSLPSEADYSWNVTCYSTTGSSGSGITDRNLSYHLAPPTVLLLKPVDANLIELNTVDFNFTLRSNEVAVSDCNLKINTNMDANHFHLGSLVSSDTNYSIRYSLPSEADYNWNITCYGQNGSSASGASDRNLSYHVNLVSLRTGLLGYWKADNNALDASGNGNNATWTLGSAGYATGKFDSAFAFNGSSEATVTMNNMPSQETFTVSVWAKANRTTMRNGNMFGWGHDWSADTFSLMIGGADSYGDVLSNQLVFLNGYNCGWRGTGYYLTDLNWHHFLATADNTTIKIYVDGNITPNAQIVCGDATMSSLVHMGHWPGGYYQSGQSGAPFLRYYDGNVDEAAMWNRVLTSTEIANLYNSGVGRKLN